VKLVVVTATAMEIPALAAVAPDLGVAMRGFTRDDLADRQAIETCLQALAHCDAALFHSMGGASSIPACEELLAACSGLIHVQASPGCDDDTQLALAHSTLAAEPDFPRRSLYLRFGGEANARSFLLQLLADCGSPTGDEIPAPRQPPMMGIHHPDLDGALLEVDDYLGWARERCHEGALVIGLWFYQGFWQNRDLALIDALIAAIEARGAIALAVFHNRFPDPDLDHGGGPAALRRFFLDASGAARIDALLSPVPFSLAAFGHEHCYRELDVPVIQLINAGVSYDQWAPSLLGVSPMDVSISAAQPEFDGCLISTIVATRETAGRDPLSGATLATARPIPDRVERVVDLACNWARLRHTPWPERKIAILFHHAPPRADNLGGAYGLDSFESINRLLARLVEAGADSEPWEHGEALAHDLLSRLTNDRRWLEADEQAKRAVARLPSDTVAAWDGELPETVRALIHDHWGQAPGPVFGHDGELLIGGLRRGKVFIGVQPPRGFLAMLEDGGDDATHDPDLPFPFHYPAFYRWLREGFGAQAVVHVGTHGTLEWLPGKACGIARDCQVDVAIADLPNIYPYIVNNPGEGTQAKRRGAAAIIDHLPEPRMTADLAPPLQALADQLDEILRCRAEDPAKLPRQHEELWQMVESAKLHSDLSLEREQGLTEPLRLCEKLHEYLNRIRDTAVNDGLHILGQAPTDDALRRFLLSCCRLPFGEVEALWDIFARERGLDPEDLRERLGAIEPRSGKTFGDLRRAIMDEILALFAAFDASDWSDARIDAQPIARRTCLRALRDHIRAPLAATSDELDACLHAFAGGFIAPGNAGCPTRGQIEVLPTGRNFCSLDPFMVPSRQAWEQGVRLGDALVARHRADHDGAHPKQVGIIVWASPTMRTRGDDVAEVFYLLGLRPVWHPSGRVIGLELLGRDEIAARGFPRLDATIRSSSLFRDAFRNLMDLLDEGVCMVAALGEPAEENVLAANARAECSRLMAEGLSPAEAQRQSTLRVFSEKPGTHGAGMDHLLQSGQWADRQELGACWTDWGSYAFGQGLDGAHRPGLMRERLRRLDCTVQNLDSREYDILAMDDVMLYQGGMNAAVLAAGGEAASYTVDGDDPRSLQVRSTAEEAKFVFRSRLLNPKWITGMQRHGFKAAGDLASQLEYCVQWDATSAIIDDWQYEELAKTYALDEDMQRFFAEHNPDAALHIAEQLLDAIQRGLWENPGDLRERLEERLLEAEGRIEERLLWSQGLGDRG